MAQRPKEAPKKKGPKNTSTDKAQSARFIETARMLGVDEDRATFDKAIAKIVPVKRRK